MRPFAAALLLLICTSPAFAELTVAERCQRNAVVVATRVGHGSGVAFTRTDAEGTDTTFVWTAAHVVNSVMKDDGTFGVLTTMRGDRQARAIVLRAGDHAAGRDIALLQVVDPDEMIRGNAQFYRAFNQVRPGQEVLLVGTPLGPMHECSVYHGCISYVGRDWRYPPLHKAREMDQVNVTAYPGCSGGPVCDKETGGIVGLISLGGRPGLAAIEPARFIYDFAKSHDCLWAFDREVPLPTQLVAWRGDLVDRLIAERETTQIDARWGSPFPEAPSIQGRLLRTLIDLILPAVNLVLSPDPSC